MKAKNSMIVVFVCILLALAVGCSQKPNDAQIIGEVAQKIQADSNLQTKTVAVQSNDGVVTLSGTVASDAERTAAANDAGQVKGVRTVVNNLAVQQAAAPAPAPVEQPVAEQPKPEPAKSSARHWSAPKSHSKPSNNDNSIPNDTVAQSTPAPATVVPAAPPKPVTVTIPDGTELSIRLIDPLDTEKNQVGDSFRATLNHSVQIDDRTAVPAGADVTGRVVDVKGATHFTGKAVLAVELVSLQMGGKTYELHTQEYRKEGTARGKNTAEKVGGGAALGAIIGGLAGGGKGAAIGATVGAGAGGGVNAATKGQKIQFPAESVLSFRLANSVTVTPGAVRNSDRPTLSDRTAE
jgi:BON domain